MNRVVLVVPCYNEAARLDGAALLFSLRSDPATHFLMVDDGSKDRTGEVLLELQRTAPEGRVKIVTLGVNSGKAEAVRRGVLAALDEGPSGFAADAVGYWDADLATPLSELPAFIRTLRTQPQTLAVIGSRVKLMGRHIERRTIRHYSGRVFATFAALALGFPVYDTQCGAKVFRATDKVRGIFAEPFASKWAFDVEVLARIAALHGEDIGSRRVVVELPLSAWKDVPGSKVKLRHLPRMLRDLWAVRRRYGDGRGQ